MSRLHTFILMFIALCSYADDRPSIHLVHPRNEHLNFMALRDSIEEVPGYDHYTLAGDEQISHIWLQTRTFIDYADIQRVDYNIDDNSAMMTLSQHVIMTVFRSFRNTTHGAIGFVLHGQLITTAQVDLRAIFTTAQLTLIFPSSEHLRLIKETLNELPNQPMQPTGDTRAGDFEEGKP